MKRYLFYLLILITSLHAEDGLFDIKDYRMYLAVYNMDVAKSDECYNHMLNVSATILTDIPPPRACHSHSLLRYTSADKKKAGHFSMARRMHTHVVSIFRNLCTTHKYRRIGRTYRWYNIFLLYKTHIQGGPKRLD